MVSLTPESSRKVRSAPLMLSGTKIKLLMSWKGITVFLWSEISNPFCAEINENTKSNKTAANFIT